MRQASSMTSRPRVLICCNSTVRRDYIAGDRFANRIGVEAAGERGVRVVDTTHGSSLPVAEWALALMLIGLRNGGAQFRRLIGGDEFQRSTDDPGYRLGELT